MGLSELMALMEDTDGQISAFARGARISCPRGCGSCCETPSRNIECTTFEALPMALRLWETGRAEEAHAMALDAGDEGHCMIYEEVLLDTLGGGCSEYAWRPLICRLFGFSSTKDKHGEPRLILCRLINTDATAEGIVKMGVEIPSITDICSRARALGDPALSAERLSINRALAGALEKIMLMARMLDTEG